MLINSLGISDFFIKIKSFFIIKYNMLININLLIALFCVDFKEKLLYIDCNMKVRKV